MADDGKTIPTGIQLTVFDEVFRNHPHERFDALRDAEPVHHDKMINRYVLTRASDVAAVLKDRRLSRDPKKAAPDSASALVLGEAREDPSPSILFLDDPDHKRLRALVTKAFNAHAIESMRGHIAEIADGLLDQIADKPEFDLIADFASPLPIIVIAEMLGIDPADRADFRRWSLGLNQGFSPAKTPEILSAMATNRTELRAYLATAIEARRAAPRKDLISAMIAAESDGDRMTSLEIVVMCELLLLAGNLTTTDLIGNGVHALMQNASELAKLRARPELISAAVEETLRRDPPVPTSARVSLDETIIDGVAIPPGSTIMPMLMAGSLDPALHHDPLKFDLERVDKTHFAFGGGAHFCLGALLAKAEAEIAIERLLARYPALALAERPLERNLAPAFNGFAQIWLHA